MNNKQERSEVVHRVIRQSNNDELKEFHQIIRNLMSERGIVTISDDGQQEDSITDELGRLVKTMTSQLKVEYNYNPNHPQTYGLPPKFAPYDSLSHLLDASCMYEAIGRLPSEMVNE